MGEDEVGEGDRGVRTSACECGVAGRRPGDDSLGGGLDSAF